MYLVRTLKTRTGLLIGHFSKIEAIESKSILGFVNNVGLEEY